MAYEFATYEKQGRIAIVTINRPERMNALHPPANFELHEIWNDFEADPEVWVGILTGAGDKAFSAGNDLRFTAEHGRDMVRMADSGFGGLANRTTNWKPILAAVPREPSAVWQAAHTAVAIADTWPGGRSTARRIFARARSIRGKGRR